MRTRDELLRAWSRSGGDARPWYALTAVPDVDLDEDELVLPAALEALARARTVWVAPLEAPFFGTRVRCVDAEGAVARLSPRTRLGPEIFAEGVLVRALHPDLEDRYFGPDARDAADGRPLARPTKLERTVSLSLDDLAGRADVAALRAEHQRIRAEVQAHYDEGVITEGERFNVMIDHGDRLAADANRRVLDHLPPRLAALRTAGALARSELLQLVGVPGILSHAEDGLEEAPVWTSLAAGRTAHEWFRVARLARFAASRTFGAKREAERLWIGLARVLGGVTVTLEDCGQRGGRWYPVDSDEVWGRTTLDGAAVDAALADALLREGRTHVRVRTLTGCAAPSGGVCARCHGLDPTTGQRPALGARVGARAARVIGELATRLEERRVSICGVFLSGRERARTVAHEAGVVRYVGAQVGAFDLEGRRQLRVLAGGRLELWAGDVLAQELPLTPGAEVFFAEGERVHPGARLVDGLPGLELRLADLPEGVEATVELRDPHGALEEGVDAVTGLSRPAVRADADRTRLPELHLVWTREDGEAGRRTLVLWPGTLLEVRPGDRVRPGAILAKHDRTRATERSGLEHLTALLEAAPVPGGGATLVRAAGRVTRVRRVEPRRSAGRIKRAAERTGHVVTVEREAGGRDEYVVRSGWASAREGDHVEAGAPLEASPRDHHDLLAVLGPAWLAEHLADELQAELATAAPRVSPTHAELVARALTRWRRVTDAGGTSLVRGAIVEVEALERAAREAEGAGRPLPRAEPVLLGLDEVASRTPPRR